MNFVDAIKSVFTKYVDFSGRARRSEYWWFLLFNLVVGLVLGKLGIVALSGLYSLATLIPGLAVAVRRLHDIGKSGFWIFICLIPVVGAIMLIVFYAKDSMPGDNQYGPNPKGM